MKKRKAHEQRAVRLTPTAIASEPVCDRPVASFGTLLTEIAQARAADAPDAPRAAAVQDDMPHIHVRLEDFERSYAMLKRSFS